MDNSLTDNMPRAKFLTAFLWAVSLLPMTWAADIGLSFSGTDDTPALSAALARMEDGDRLLLAHGTYRFHADSTQRLMLEPSNNGSGEKCVVFPLLGRRRVVIDGQGSRLVFHRGTFPFAIRNCEDVTLRNFTVACDIAPYVSCTVVAKDNAGFRVRLDEGSAPMDLSARHISVHAIERQRQCFYIRPGDTEPVDWVPTRFICCTPEPCGDSEWLLRYRPHPSPKCIPCPYDVGERIAFNVSGNRDRIFAFVEDSSRVTMEDVTIRNFGGMGVLAQRSADITLRRYVVAPEQGRPVTLTADASHFVNCSGTVCLEDCEISWMLDDACNVHGNYLETVEAVGHAARLRVGHFEQRGFFPYKVGDLVEFVEPNRRTVLRATKVTRVMRHSDSEVTIETEADLTGLPAGTLVEDVTRCPDVVIRGCHFHDFPHFRLSGRGKLLVEGNRIERCSVGLYCYDLAKYWYESGRIADLTVRKNVFDACDARREQPGPFLMFGLTGWKATDKDIPIVHGRVLLESNEFRHVRAGEFVQYGVRDFTQK